jgi:hypothetical protein
MRDEPASFMPGCSFLFQQETEMKDDFELIHSYSRKQATEDGVLIDVTPAAREAGLTIPVTVTAAVFRNYVRVPDGVTAQDEPGRLRDILWMLRFAISRHREVEGDTLLFTVFVRNDDTEPKPVKLKAIVHPGDEGEPVVTVLMPDED